MELPGGMYHNRHTRQTFSPLDAVEAHQMPAHGVTYLKRTLSPNMTTKSRGSGGNARTPLVSAADWVTPVHRDDWLTEPLSAQSSGTDDEMKAANGSDVIDPESFGGRRRNARERNRVRTINSTFARLRQKLPLSAAYSVAPKRRPWTVQSSSGAQAMTTSYRARKLSKVQILRAAIEYIRTLQDELVSLPHPQQRVTLSNTTRCQLQLQQQQYQHHCHIR